MDAFLFDDPRAHYDPSSLPGSCRVAYDAVCQLANERLKRCKKELRERLKRNRLCGRPLPLKVLVAARLKFCYRSTCQEVVLALHHMLHQIMCRGCGNVNCGICHRPSRLSPETPGASLELPGIRRGLRFLQSAVDTFDSY